MLVVDDGPDLRQLVRLTLESAGGFTIVGEAGDGGTALAAAASLRPDIVVLDIGLPAIGEMSVLATLRQLVPDARIIVFSGLDDRTEDAALSGETASYVLQAADVEVLLSALRDLGAVDRTPNIELANDVRSVAEARRFAGQWCERWGLDDLTDAVLLVTSELVTNVVRHAYSACRLRLRLSPRWVRLEVEDVGEGSPSPQLVDGGSAGGRGLYIISSLCQSWGVDSAPGGKVVWAELSR